MNTENILIKVLSHIIEIFGTYHSLFCRDRHKGGRIRKRHMKIENILIEVLSERFSLGVLIFLVLLLKHHWNFSPFGEMHKYLYEHKLLAKRTQSVVCWSQPPVHEVSCTLASFTDSLMTYKSGVNDCLFNPCTNSGNRLTRIIASMISCDCYMSDLSMYTISDCCWQNKHCQTLKLKTVTPQTFFHPEDLLLLSPGQVWPLQRSSRHKTAGLSSPHCM